VQLACRVPDHIVDDIVGESAQGALDVTLGFLAKVLLQDPVDGLRRKAGGGCP
jgi:hypothetical protein